LNAQAILLTFIVSCVVAVLAYIAHRRFAGTGQRAGCVSMIAFVVVWLAALTALITALFLLGAGSG
jgi:hypothetical protein